MKDKLKDVAEDTRGKIKTRKRLGGKVFIFNFYEEQGKINYLVHMNYFSRFK